MHRLSLAPVVNLLHRFARAVLLAGAALVVQALPAQELLPVPLLDARVIDQTGSLNSAQRTALNARLVALEQQKGTQLVILMVRSTRPEDIASYANRVANSWKIGRRDVGDGVLLIVATDDRSLRIEVAKALEGAVPDLAAKRIIDGAITPRFKVGDFAGGLEAGVDQLAARIAGETLPEPARAQSRGAEPDWGGLLVLVLFALPVGAAIVRSIFGRKLGALLTGGGVALLGFVIGAHLLLACVAGLAAALFALLGGSSGLPHGWGRPGGFGGGWGSGGGGFRSGGGGDFGGGGASGRW